MPAKKFGCFRKVLAVVFSSIVAPVVANVVTQEATTWRQELESKASAQWELPPVETAAPATPTPLRKNRTATDCIETMTGKHFHEWRDAAFRGR